MPAYIIFTRVRTRKPEELALHAKEAPNFVAGHNIKWLARFGPCEVKEGAAVEAVAILEFLTIDEAKAFYDSPAYQEASKHRFQGGDYNAIIVSGT